MIRSCFVALALFFAAALPPAALGASTFVLTGTWSGSYTCKSQVNGVPTKLVVKDATMRITHIAEAFFAGMVITSAEDATHQFDGHVFEATKSGTGAGTFVECGTTSDSVNQNGQVLAAPKISVSPSAKNPASATFVATSTFQAPNTVGGTCKFKFSRTSTADPIVGGCAPACPVIPPMC